MTNGNKNTFPKAEKLKSLKQIDLVFREGKSFFAAPVKCYYRLTGLEIDGLIGLNVDGLTGLKVGELTGVKVASGIKIGDYIPENQTSNTKDQTPTLKPETITHKQQIIKIKCGVSVSKKNFKKSVDRNHIKRLLREAYRIHKAPLYEKLEAQQRQLEVFFVFTDRTLPTFNLVEEKMKYCIRRLGKIVEGGA